jgi:Tetratricopeptide repeat
VPELPRRQFRPGHQIRSGPSRRLRAGPERHPELRNNLANAYQDAGRLDKAEDLLNRTEPRITIIETASAPDVR